MMTRPSHLSLSSGLSVTFQVEVHEPDRKAASGPPSKASMAVSSGWESPDFLPVSET